MERTDVLFVGRAHAPPGMKIEQTTVRLAVVDGRVPVLDKRLQIVGDRDAADAPPTPFDSMPIVYERAYGGLGFPENPLGVGIGGDGKLHPNVLHHDATRPRAVAGFGPRSTSWLVRKKLLRGHPRPKTDEIAELPDDFDWIYFQAAPPDQWLDALPSRAWIILEGLNPRTKTLRMRLPAMRVWARLQIAGQRSAGEPIELRADTLFIDGDAEHCTVAWRASITVPSVEALSDTWAAVAMEVPERPLAWPPRPSPSSTRVVHGAGSAADESSSRKGRGSKRPPDPMSGTLAIDDIQPRTNRPVRPTHAASGTMIVDADAMAAAATGAPKSRARTMILEQPASLQRKVGTMVVETLPPVTQPLPFVGGANQKRRRPTPAPLPGAPWAPATSAKTPRRAPDSLSETLDAPTSIRPSKAAREAEQARAEQAARADAALRAAEADAKEAARRREEAAALARREAEREEEAKAAADRFAKEQAAARKTDAEREAAAAAERARGIKDLKKKAYGGFDD